MDSTPISESLAAVMRNTVVSDFVSAQGLQYWLGTDEASLLDTLTGESRGRLSEDETHALVGTVSEVALPHSRLVEAAAVVEFDDAGINYGYPSYRAAAASPTDGAVTLAISWRFTIPHRNTVISEIENLWAHTVGDPLAVPEPRPEREPLTVGTVALNVGLDCTIFMDDGVFNPAEIDDILKPRAYTEGGPELLTDGEATLVKRLMRALVDGDRDVLDEVGAFVDDRDPYMWTYEYGRFGHVHFAMPPVEFSEWDVSVLHVDDRPGESQVIVGMWTREEGASDLSLEIILNTDATSGVVRGEFDNLHVM